MTEQEFTGWLNSISFTNTEVSMEQKERCRANVFKGWHNYRCQRTAVKDGWCKQHHPDSEKARREAQDRRYEEKMKQSAWYLLAKAKERIQDWKQRSLDSKVDQTTLNSH